MEALNLAIDENGSAASCWARGMSSFRRFLYFLLVLALLALVALLLIKDNLNDQIQKVVEKKLQEVLVETGVDVSISQAEYKRGRGIRLRGLQFVQEGISILSVDELLVETDLDIWDLISGRLDINRVSIEGVQVLVTQDSNQQVNWQSIITRMKLPKQKAKQPIPPLELKNCKVQLRAEGIGKDIHLLVQRANIASTESQSAMLGSAVISSDYFREVAISGEYGLKDKHWKVWGNARRFWLTREVFHHIPQQFQKDIAALSDLKAIFDFDFEVSGDVGSESLPQFLVVGGVKEGVINDERLPFPISSLSANFQADNTGVKFENVVAESLLGRMHLNFKTEGLSNQSPFELVAKVDPLYLDERLVAKLPPQAQEFLRKFSPHGNVRIDSRLSFKEGRWVPDVVVDLLDVSFAFHKFPYPLQNATGRIKLDDERVVIDVVAYASGKKVVMDGEFLNPGPDSYGQLEIAMDGIIPMDAKIQTAMEQMPDISKVMSQFHPRGYLGFSGVFRRERQQDETILESFRHQIDVQKAEFKYDLMPIAFEQVSGSIVVTERGTSLLGFRGKNINSNNVAQGSWDPINGLSLTIDSYDLELNDSLRSALPPKAIEVWDQMRPSGTLEVVRSKVWARPRQPIYYEIDIRQQADDHELKVFPVWFPYELKGVKTRLALKPGKFEIQQFKGKHRRTTVSVLGHGHFEPQSWECHLSQIHFDRLEADREFTSALPKALGDTVDSFDVKGLFNIGGKISFRGTPNRNPTRTEKFDIETSWDLTADIDQGYLMCGVKIENIYGAVRLTGYARGEHFESLGGLEIDSLVWNDVQFRNVRSPLYLDNHEALLGYWATAKRKNSKPEALTGILFGGKLAGNARFSLHGNQPFEIHATLNQGDLREFTFEMVPNYEEVVGKAFAGIHVVGDKTGTHSLRGKGEVKLLDAEISEIPVMLSMLKLLSIRQVDQTLFNESHVDFRLRGEHLYFDNLEFLGDAISIKGNGEMDFDQNIDLQFYTAVGRDGFRIPVISPLLGAASQQILVIDVDGTTSQPKVKKNFFKILNNKLKENLKDLEDSIDEGSGIIRDAAVRPFESFR